MSILDAPFSGSSRAPATGSSASRRIGDWLAETQRRRQITPTLPAVMSSPPTTTLTKAVGVSAAAVSAGGSGYVVGEFITLTGGTAAVQARLKVATLSGSAVATVSVDTPGVYSAAPTNPAAQGSSTGVGTGATFTLTTNGASASSLSGIVTLNAPTSTVFDFTGNGPGNQSSSGYYGNTVGNGTASYFEWDSDSPQLDIKLLGLNSNLNLLVDVGSGFQRVASSSIATDASGQPYIYTVAWGGVQTTRRYRLTGVNMAFGGVRTAGVDSVWAPLYRRPLAWCLGDSYAFGTGASQLCINMFHVMCNALGLDPIPDGIGGTGWLSAAGNAPDARVAGKLLTLTRPPQYVFLDLGFNDAGGNMTTLSTNFTATVAAIRAGLPLAKIIVFGPATPLGATGNLTTVKTTLSGLCTTLGLDFVDVENWINSSNKQGYTGGDNTHPTDAGHQFIGARKALAVAAII